MTIRFGIIGVGGMGNSHVRNIMKLKGAKLTAVCDIIEERAKRAAEICGAKYFCDYRALIDSKLCDAVIIATPHYDHSPIAIYAMNHGLHVISEKPLGVSLSAIDKMIAAANKTGMKFSVMFQWRTMPLWQTARKVIQSGKLGKLMRVHYVQPDYRSQAYYDSDPWRGTWAGEGGGVLVNQAPHYTDMMWWLVGEPKSVMAKTRTKLHNIEGEDEGEAILEFPNGASGYYYTCTAESGGRRYVRIVGDKAVLEIDDKLRLGKYKTPLSKFDRTNTEPWGNPGIEWTDVPVPERASGHIEIVKNFMSAINRGTKLLAPGSEGIHQAEITCAMILSSFTGKPVTLPVNRAAYDRMLSKLVRESKGKKSSRKIKHTEEVTHF